MLKTSDMWLALSDFHKKKGEGGSKKLHQAMDVKFEEHVARFPVYVQKILVKAENRASWDEKEGFECLQAVLASPSGLIDPPVPFDAFPGKEQVHAISAWREFEKRYTSNAVGEVESRLEARWVCEVEGPLSGLQVSAVAEAKTAFKVAAFYPVLEAYLKENLTFRQDAERAKGTSLGEDTRGTETQSGGPSSGRKRVERGGSSCKSPRASSCESPRAKKPVVGNRWVTVTEILCEGIGTNAAQKKKLEAYCIKYDPVVKIRGGLDLVLSDRTGLIGGAAWKTKAGQVLSVISGGTPVLLLPEGFKIGVVEDNLVPYATITINEETTISLVTVATQPSTIDVTKDQISSLDVKFYKSVFNCMNLKTGTFFVNVSRFSSGTNTLKNDRSTIS